MNYRSRKPSLFSLSNSKLILFIGILVTAFMSVNLIKAINENKSIQNRIDKLQSDLQAEEQKQAQLEAARDYTQTDLFVEEEARNRLNLKKEGEIVVSLPPERIPVLEEVVAQQQAIEEFEKQPNPQKWFQYFFGEILAAETPAAITP
jgi:cell division protein FtsB